MRSCFYPLPSVRRVSAVKRGLIAALVLVGAAGAASAQIQDYAIFRNANYRQNAPDSVTGPLFYNASFDITLANLGDATGFTAAPVGGNVVYGVSGSDSTHYSAFSDSFNTRADFESALPAGDYVYTVNGGTYDGVANTLTVPDMSAFPQEIPQLTPDSYNALQSYNGTAPVTLNWNTFTVPDGYDPQVFLYLIPQGTGIPFTSNPLGPDATSFTINPGLLSSSTNYRGFLYFYGSQRSDGQDNGAGGVPSAFVIYQNVTSFLFSTGAGTAAAEPSAAGLALAPFVFAGAAYLRRRFRRRK